MIKGTNLDYILHIRKLLLMINMAISLPSMLSTHQTRLIKWSKTTFGNIVIILTAIFIIWCDIIKHLSATLITVYLLTVYGLLFWLRIDEIVMLSIIYRSLRHSCWKYAVTHKHSIILPRKSKKKTKTISVLRRIIK